MAKAIGVAPDDLESIASLESSLVLPSFTADTAWELGVMLRNRLHNLTHTPCVIDITMANSHQILFHACSRSGTCPDNDVWVTRKRATVLRWGCSSWFMHKKFQGDELRFAEKYGLGTNAGTYAIHGGGVPIRVKGVGGVVAVIVVSGLKQNEDHMVAVEGIEELIAQRGSYGTGRSY